MLHSGICCRCLPLLKPAHESWLAKCSLGPGTCMHRTTPPDRLQAETISHEPRAVSTQHNKVGKKARHSVGESRDRYVLNLDPTLSSGPAAHMHIDDAVANATHLIIATPPLALRKVQKSICRTFSGSALLCPLLFIFRLLILVLSLLVLKLLALSERLR